MEDQDATTENSDSVNKSRGRKHVMIVWPRTKCWCGKIHLDMQKVRLNQRVVTRYLKQSRRNNGS